MFLTLGDATIYSTYLYLHAILLKEGYDASILNGIPSFCATAALLNIGLAERDQPLHILPGADSLEEALQLSGTRILMKTGRHLQNVKKRLLESKADIYFVENCGMEQERVYVGAENIPEESGYFSLLIIKEKE